MNEDALILPSRLTSTGKIQFSLIHDMVTTMQLSSIPVQKKTSSSPDKTTVNSCNTDTALIETHLICSLYL